MKGAKNDVIKCDQKHHFFAAKRELVSKVN